MTARNDFNGVISDWLVDQAGRGAPGYLDEILARTTRTRQRPAWSSLERWLPMQTTLRFAAVPRVAWLLVLIALLAALGAAVLAVGSQPRQLPPPFGPARNGSIVYEVDRDIGVADPDATNHRILIGDPETDVAPLVSNDGTRFSFFRQVTDVDYDVYVANVDGTGIRKLTQRPLTGVTWADWSPDGSRIVVLHTTGRSERAVSIVATDGSGVTLALPPGTVVPESPTWRPPTGREIILRGVTDGGVSLYAMGADGTGLDAIAPVLQDADSYLGLRLSPDGTSVTYWHNLKAEVAEGRKSEIHVVNLVTGLDRRVGYDPASRHELLPKFSPDGKSILFVRFPRASDASVMIAAVDGSGVARQIGPLQQWGGNPIFEFSPDGTKIILTFGSGSPMQVIDVATGAVVIGNYADWPSWQRLAA